MSQCSVEECRKRLARASGVELASLIDAYGSDARQTVKAAVKMATRRLQRERVEHARLRCLLDLENTLRQQGLAHIAGVDEVGRGALAGPVTAAAVILPPGVLIEGLDDSKRLSPARRVQVGEQVKRTAIALAIAHVPAHVIDGVGMTVAVRTVMVRALTRLNPVPDHVITDGLRVGLPMPETPVVKGDAKVAAVAAASVIAKVARDTLMVQYEEPYPGWGFAGHKGYGSASHLEAIHRLGLSPIHRRSFSPCDENATLF